MKLWGRNREVVKVQKAIASRVVFHGIDHQEIELRLVTEDGEKLTLIIPPRIVHKLVGEISNAYEAVNPPLRRGSGPADFLGMDDFE